MKLRALVAIARSLPACSLDTWRVLGALVSIAQTEHIDQQPGRHQRCPGKRRDPRTHIIKSGGESALSVAVEAVVLEAPGVAECAIIGVPGERWGEAICALVVSDGTVAPKYIEAGVIAHAESTLARDQVPKQVITVERLPKTATGKIQKQEVRGLIQ